MYRNNYGLLPLVGESFDVFFDEVGAALDFNEGEWSYGFESVELSLGDTYDIAAFYGTLLAIEDYQPFAVDESPNFITICVTLIAD